MTTSYEKLFGTPERVKKTFDAIADALSCLESCDTCWYSGDCWKQEFLNRLIEDVDDGE